MADKYQNKIFDIRYCLEFKALFYLTITDLSQKVNHLTILSSMLQLDLNSPLFERDKVQKLNL